MTKREIYWTRYGEMLDMIACMAIENGAKQKKEMTQEQILFDMR